MQLILKQPAGKAPCICVLFGNEYTGARHNSGLVLNNSAQVFEIVIEGADPQNMTMLLSCRQMGIRETYRGLRCSAEKLKMFLMQTRDAKVFSFCHVFRKEDKDTVCVISSNRKPFVLKVGSVKMLGEEF